jgi:hypothetical protein
MEGTDMSKDDNAAADIAIPAAAKRWNWGAFLMSWIGDWNNTHIALCLIPVVNIVMAFVLKIKAVLGWKRK